MFYRGKGNHGVYQLEELVEHFKEESYQKQLKIQEIQAKLDKAVSALERLSKSGDGTHGSKHASFYDCLPTLQIEFSERLDFARETIAEIGKG
jgi:lipopolysaccharide biosynthesis regulator YciM